LPVDKDWQDECALQAGGYKRLKDWNFSNGSGGVWNRLPDDAAQAVAFLSLSRMQRIEQICKAMNEGMYRIEGQRIADKMVSDAVRCLRERIR
jgi:hypothetical protein